MTITTERLVLRPFQASDVEAVHAYGSDPEVTRYVSFGPNTPADTRDFLARCAAEKDADPRCNYNLAITLREEDRPIGGTGFTIRDTTQREAEMGYVLHREHWGHGIATEAANAVVRFGFESAKLHRIVARCHPDNPKSAHVMEKIGMSYEGRQRQVVWIKGSWWDFLVYSILEDEWREKNGIFTYERDKRSSEEII